MKLKSNIRNCLNLLQQDCSLYTENFEILNSGCDTPLSLALCKRRSEKTKKNPYFLWNDVRKLEASIKEFKELACMVMPPNTASENLWHYQTLVKELVSSLKESIYELCRSHDLSLHSSFPNDFEPQVKDENFIELSSELLQGQGETLLAVEQPLEGKSGK